MAADERRAEIDAEAVDVVAEFLHTGGPSLNADQAAIEIVGVLSRAGFLDRLRDARGDDEATVCSACGLSEPFPAWHYRSECTNAPVVTHAEYQARSPR